MKKTLAEMWQSYVDQVIGCGRPGPIVILERLSFYSGVARLLETMHEMNAKPVTAEEGGQTLDAWGDELDAFFKKELATADRLMADRKWPQGEPRGVFRCQDAQLTLERVGRELRLAIHDDVAGVSMGATLDPHTVMALRQALGASVSS